MVSKTKSKTANQTQTKYDTDKESTKEISERENKIVKKMSQKYGGPRGKSLAKLHKLGLYDVKKAVKKDVGKMERRYASLDSMIGQYQQKRDQISSKMDELSQTKVKAGVLKSRYQSMANDMYNRYNELQGELKTAKVKSNQDGDQTYLEILDEMRKLKGDLRNTEYNINQTSTKIASFDKQKDDYRNKVNRLDDRLRDAESAKNKVEESIDHLKFLLEQDISPLSLVKTVRKLYQGVANAEDISQSIDEKMKEMPNPTYGNHGSNSDHGIEREKQIAKDYDEIRKQADQIMKKDIEV